MSSYTQRTSKTNEVRITYEQNCRDPFKADIVTRTNILFRHLPDYLQSEVDRKLILEEEGDCDE